MKLQDKAFKNFKRNVNIQENIIAEPRVLLVNLDQLKKKITSDQLAKITPIFIWEGNKSFIYNYPQSHFTSGMTKRHLWRVLKILMLLGMLNHSVKNITFRFIAFLNNNCVRRVWGHLLIPSKDIKNLPVLFDLL